MSRKPKSQENSSNNISIDIHELGKNAKENALKTDLIRSEEKCVALSEAIDSLLKKLEEKEEELVHLKQMLFATTPVIGEISPMMISDEEMIAQIQLQKIKDNARIRELTLDEIKKFDLLVKNKRLSQGNATTINADKLDKNMPKDKLIQIAAKKTSTQGDS